MFLDSTTMANKPLSYRPVDQLYIAFFLVSPLLVGGDSHVGHSVCRSTYLRLSCSTVNHFTLLASFLAS